MDGHKVIIRALNGIYGYNLHRGNKRSAQIGKPKIDGDEIQFTVTHAENGDTHFTKDTYRIKIEKVKTTKENIN